MRIRQFDLDDYEAAARVWASADEMAVPSYDECATKLERDPHLFLVAEDDATSDVVGVVMGTYDGRRGWIFRLAVDPIRRKSGIGRALVHELERRYSEMGVAHIRLLVYELNHSGREFWRRLGYEEFDQIVMSAKDLPLGGDDAEDVHC